MNLVQLRYAQVVADTGSFSAAARFCGVSQPSISNAIGSLEMELGAKLFKRTTRQVELTTFGRELLGPIDNVLGSVLDLQRQAQTLLNPERKLLRIAFSPIIDSRRLMALFEPFKRQRTGLEIVYKECGLDNLEERLETEQIDIVCGIGLREGANRGRCALYSDTLRYLPRGGLANYRGPQTVTTADIAKDNLILTVGVCGLADATRELFLKSRQKITVYPGQALGYQALQEWSELGIGAAVLPGSRIVGDASAYPLIGTARNPATIQYEAVWDKNFVAPSHLRDFIRYMKSAVATLAKDGQWGGPDWRKNAVAQKRLAA